MVAGDGPTPKPGWGLGQITALGDTLSPGLAKAGVSVGIGQPKAQRGLKSPLSASRFQRSPGFHA